MRSIGPHRCGCPDAPVSTLTRRSAVELTLARYFFIYVFVIEPRRQHIELTLGVTQRDDECIFLTGRVRRYTVNIRMDQDRTTRQRLPCETCRKRS